MGNRPVPRPSAPHPAPLQPAPLQPAAAPPAEAALWPTLLDLRAALRGGRRPPLRLPIADLGASLAVAADATWTTDAPLTEAAAAFIDLYLPVCLIPAGTAYAIGHLGQSLDGRIATATGASRWITGEADILHNHRLRALADVVLVGAGTVRHDDPQLTVRHCAGQSPVRCILDTNRTLDPGHRVFTDGAAPTLVVAAEDALGPPLPAGIDIIRLPRGTDGLDPAAVLAALGRRGLEVVFVEGGGVTVSRFLAAGVLDRLQVTVAPLIIGSGRMGISLPEIAEPRQGMRPPTRRFDLGEDVLFDCVMTDWTRAR